MLSMDSMAELRRLQGELMTQYEEEHAKYQAGEFQEKPQDWLHSSWQGAALQVVCLDVQSAIFYLTYSAPRHTCCA